MILGPSFLWSAHHPLQLGLSGRTLNGEVQEPKPITPPPTAERMRVPHLDPTGGAGIGAAGVDAVTEGVVTHSSSVSKVSRICVMRQFFPCGLRNLL